MNIPKVAIVRLPILVPRWAVAQVLLPRRIFVRRGVKLTKRLLAHELVHVDQIERLGLFRYWWIYLLWLLRCGYREHPLEFDAIVRGAEYRFLEAADRLLLEAERESAGTRNLSSRRPLDLR